MPQLLSRVDDSNWLTPSIAEILEQGAAPPGGDGSIQQQTRILTQELNELGTPARIINVRPTPSHTLFIAQPSGTGRLGGRKITPVDIRRSLAKVAEQHKEWTLGFLPELQEEGTVGILLRADHHQPISLRRMLVRPTFRDTPSRFTLALGLTLEEQLVLRDLSEIGSLFVIGGDKAKQHFIRACILTLALLNTPAELRVAIAGQSAGDYAALGGLPHTLGRILNTPEEGQRLLEGLIKEIQRRQQWFQENNVNNIVTYNQRLKEQGNPSIPRILLLLDSLTDESWAAVQSQWAPLVEQLIQHSVATGIHLLMSAGSMPEPLARLNAVQVIMRSSANEVIERLKDFPKPSLRFVDCFVVSETGEITPVELCTISTQEIDRAVDYWRQAVQKRKQEGVPTVTQETARVGLTAMLNPDVVNRAIAAREAATAPAASPAVGSMSESDRMLIKQASALAAYLGWLSAAALRDVLMLSEQDSRALLAVIQRLGVVESGDQPVLRFVRLAENPLNNLSFG